MPSALFVHQLLYQRLSLLLVHVAEALPGGFNFLARYAFHFPLSMATPKSRFSLAMKLRLISFGQTASQEPCTVQLPNPSASICRTMLSARRSFSACPWGRKFRCETLAATNNMAD